MNEDRQLRATLIAKAIESGTSPVDVLPIVKSWMDFIDGGKTPSKVQHIEITEEPVPVPAKPVPTLGVVTNYHPVEPTTDIGRYRKRFVNGGRKYSEDEIKIIAKCFVEHSSDPSEALRVASAKAQRSAAGIKLVMKNGFLKKYGLGWSPKDTSFSEAFENSVTKLKKK